MDNDDTRTCSIFEELEPRILMSGTPAPSPVSEFFVQAEVFNEQADAENQVSEILFIDSGVKDYDSLIDGLNRNVEIVLIDDDENGIDKISSTLEGRTDISAIHILSHGDAGSISIGNVSLNSDNIKSYESQLRGWGSVLSPDADILIYGCNVGQDTAFLEEFASFTSADVAASDDLTGSDDLGGDAELEVKIGNVTVESFFNQSEFNEAGIVLGQVGPGQDLASASNADDPGGDRLNVDLTNVQTLEAGTYNVRNFQLNVINKDAGTGGSGTITPMLLTESGGSYNVIWIGDAFDPTTNGQQTAATFNLGDETFTLGSTTNVYAAFFTQNAGADIIAYADGSGLTDHDNAFTAPALVGDTVTDISHTNLTRSYAFEINVTADGAVLSADDDYTVSNPTNEDSVLNISAFNGVLANDDDIDATIISFSATSAKGASVTVNSDGSFTYDPTTSATLAALDEGETTTDTFTYTLAENASTPDGLMNVQYINTTGTNPGNNSDNWESLWDEVAGTNTTGDVVTTTGTYTVVNNNSDTETVFDYNTGGDFGTNRNINSINSDGPGGSGASTSDSNYSIRVNTFLKFQNAGTYTIAMGSDDGRRLELKEASGGSAPGYSGFTSRGDQFNGSFTSGDTVIGFSGGTGHQQTVGTFTVDAGDILELTAFYYEATGGDSGEISIANGTFNSFTNSSDFTLLSSGVEEILLGSSFANINQAINSETSTVTLSVTGVNDTPVARDDSRSITELKDDTSTLNDVSGNFFTDGTDDSDADDAISSFSITQLSNVTSGADTTGTIVGKYGTLTWTPNIQGNGTYTYTLDDSNAEVQALNDGSILQESFTYTLSDNHPAGNVKTDTAVLTITINGVNDSLLAENNSASVTEDSGAGQVASGNLISDDDSLDTNHVDGVTVDIDVDAVDLNIIEVSNSASGTDTSGSIVGDYGTLVWNKDTGAYSYTLNNGTDGVSSIVQDLKEGEQVTDVFTYKLHNGFVSGDGLMNVQYVSTSGSIPGNDTSNWLSLWDEVAGTNTTGSVVTTSGTYNITNNHSDTETIFDYNSGGDFGTNKNINTINSDGPNGGASSVSGENYSIRSNTFLAFNVGGTYTIALGSDDGRRIQLTDATPGGSNVFNGFSSRGDQVNGSFTPGDTVIGFSGGTGHDRTVGTFTVEAGDILQLDAFFYQGGGGHSGEISIAAGEFSNFTNTSDFKLITDEQFNIAVSSANNFEKAAVGFAETETDTATLTVTITGKNDAPVIDSVLATFDTSDLSGWTSSHNQPTGVGTQTPVWNVTGNSVTQTKNSHAAVLKSDFEIDSNNYSGEFNITSNSPDDNDYFGFVLGYQSGEVKNSADGFILIDWNRVAENHNVMGQSLTGLSASFVQGEDIEGANFWTHSGAVTEAARGNNFGSTGFTLGQTYNIKFNVVGDNLQIFVDDVLEFDLDASDFGLTEFPVGSFGFYNLAQENTTYEMVGISLTGNSGVSFTEGDSPVVVAPNFNITDIDANLNTGVLTVEITNNGAGSEDVLATALDFSSFAVLDGASTDQKLIFNLGALANTVNVQSLMESITYQNTAERPSLLTRDITFTLADSEGEQSSDTVNVFVSGVNDVPVLSVSTGSFSVDEEATLAVTGVSLTDIDSGSDDVQLTLSVSNGTLSINDPNTGPVTGANLVITGTIAELNTALAALTYVSDTDFSGADTINLEINDLGSHNGLPLTDTGSISIDVNPVTDAVVPTLINTDEDTSVDFSITSTDVDEGLTEILFTNVNGTISGTGVADLGGGQFRWQKPDSTDPIFDLNDFVMNSHSDQDSDPAGFTVSEDGTSIELTGNTWKNIDINYTITENTILEFEMKSDVEPELSMIMFDNNNLFSGGAGAEYFIMHGVQSLTDSANGLFNDYDGSGNFKKYTIRVGDFFTGDFSKLVFANDDDRPGAPGDTTYKNVRLFEDSPLSNFDFTFTPEQDLEVDTFVNITVQTRDGGELISTTPQLLNISINPVNDNPVISVVGGDADTAVLTETNGGLSTSGTLTVVDVDLADTVSFSTSAVSASGVITGMNLSNQQLLSMLNVSGSIDNVSTTSALNWSFDSGSEAFNYLAKGESLVLTYTVQALDDSGINTSLDTHDVVITITGTNDQPVASNSSFRISEDTSSFQQDLTKRNHELDFSDSLSVENLTFSVIGPMDEDLVFEVDENGVLSLDPSQFNYMKEGEQLKIVFVYSLVDDSGVGAGNLNDDPDTRIDTFTLVVDGKKEAPPTDLGSDEIFVNIIEEDDDLNVAEEVFEKVNAGKSVTGIESKTSFAFLSKGSSVHFNEKFLSDDSLSVIKPIFNQNLKPESEVAQNEDHTVSIEDIDVFETPLLPQNELNFIEDLKVEAPLELEEETEKEEEDEISYHSSDESMYEIASQKKERDFRIITQYNLDTQINLNESLVGDFDCFDTPGDS